MSCRMRGDRMPDSRTKMERDHGQNSHSKSRVVDLNSFRKRKSSKTKNENRFGYRSVLFGIVVILLSLSLICGILGFLVMSQRSQFAIWSAFFAVVGLVGGFVMSAVSDRRAPKLMGLLCIGLLLALIAGVVKVGL